MTDFFSKFTKIASLNEIIVYVFKFILNGYSKISVVRKLSKKFTPSVQRLHSFKEISNNKVETLCRNVENIIFISHRNEITEFLLHIIKNHILSKMKRKIILLSKNWQISQSVTLTQKCSNAKCTARNRQHHGKNAHLSASKHIICFCIGLIIWLLSPQQITPQWE